jgi:hypothetical protein
MAEATPSVARASMRPVWRNSFISGASWPCGVAVDAGHLYWGNSGESKGATCAPAIRRANLDGGDTDQAFVVGMLGLCGVALDR